MAEQNPVLAALASRRSVRAFLPRPVPRAAVETVLAAASRAPSATNTQPWRVHVLSGRARERLVEAILTERAAGTTEPEPEYPYYPASYPEPYLGRRRAIGWQLYAALGIARGDLAASRAWHDQNYRFFGAPTGLIFTLDRGLAHGAFIDLGLFMAGVMTAATALGLATCPQAAFAGYHATIRRVLAVSAEQLVVCGMALGYEDTEAVANTIRAERAPLAEFATFQDA